MPEICDDILMLPVGNYSFIWSGKEILVKYTLVNTVGIVLPAKKLN